MVWTVNVTQVLSAERSEAKNISTEEVRNFIANTVPSIPLEVIDRIWLDLVTTGAANFGLYKFSATAREDSTD